MNKFNYFVDNNKDGYILFKEYKSYFVGGFNKEITCLRYETMKIYKTQLWAIKALNKLRGEL